MIYSRCSDGSRIWILGGGAKLSHRWAYFYRAGQGGVVRSRSEALGGPGVKYRQFSTIFKLFYGILRLAQLINKKAK